MPPLMPFSGRSSGSKPEPALWFGAEVSTFGSPLDAATGLGYRFLSLQTAYAPERVSGFSFGCQKRRRKAKMDSIPSTGRTFAVNEMEMYCEVRGEGEPLL